MFGDASVWRTNGRTMVVSDDDGSGRWSISALRTGTRVARIAHARSTKHYASTMTTRVHGVPSGSGQGGRVHGLPSGSGQGWCATRSDGPHSTPGGCERMVSQARRSYTKRAKSADRLEKSRWRPPPGPRGGEISGTSICGMVCVAFLGGGSGV